MTILMAPVGKARRETLLSHLAYELVPLTQVQVDKDLLWFWSFGGWTLFRGRSVLKKEPLTIDWIRNFPPGSVFWDIGANIGAYTIFASVVRNCRVLAFEPSPLNFAVLQQNLWLNGLDGGASALPIALSDATSLGRYVQSNTLPGTTGGSIGANNSDGLEQAVLTFSIDTFLATYGAEAPNFIKLDVDGAELQILHGATELLGSDELESILVEASVDSSELIEIRDLLQTKGFVEVESEETVQGRSSPRNFIFAKSKGKVREAP